MSWNKRNNRNMHDATIKYWPKNF